MAAAYAHADGGPITNELELLSHIDRFGVYAVLGRSLGAGEIRKLRAAENVVNYYVERERCGTEWATWAKSHRQKAAVLEYALSKAVELGYINGES